MSSDALGRALGGVYRRPQALARQGHGRPDGRQGSRHDHLRVHRL